MTGYSGGGTLEKPSTKDKLGESYDAEVQQNGKHVPILCNDAQEYEHLTNHFNEQLNMKI